MGKDIALNKAIELKVKFGDKALDAAKEVFELAQFIDNTNKITQIVEMWKRIIAILTTMEKEERDHNIKMY